MPCVMTRLLRLIRIDMPFAPSMINNDNRMKTVGFGRVDRFLSRIGHIGQPI
jgi:hypothetical protein